MAVMVTLLPIIGKVGDNVIPTPEEIEASGERMDTLVARIQAELPEGIELIMPTDGRYMPAILQAVTGLLDVVDPESTEIAKRAFEALGMTGGGREKLN